MCIGLPPDLVIVIGCSLDSTGKTTHIFEEFLQFRFKKMKTVQNRQILGASPNSLTLRKFFILVILGKYKCVSKVIKPC